MSNVLEVSFAPLDPAVAKIRAELAGLGDPEIRMTPEPMKRQPSGVMNAWGTRLRLRSLIAMGHGDKRIATALGINHQKVTAIVHGQVIEVSVRLARDVVYLWEAWWDKVPPTETRAESCSFRRARALAAKWDWCTPMGLDEELIDSIYYIPGCGWLPAKGRGIADPRPISTFREAA